MDSSLIVFFPLLIFYFQWMHQQKQHRAYCPHCGGNLGSDFGMVGQRHKVPDDELAGRGSGFSIQDLPNLTLAIALASMLVLYVVVSLTKPSSPVVVPPRQPQPLHADPFVPPFQSLPIKPATPLPLPTPAPNPVGG